MKKVTIVLSLVVLALLLFLFLKPTPNEFNWTIKEIPSEEMTLTDSDNETSLPTKLVASEIDSRAAQPVKVDFKVLDYPDYLEKSIKWLADAQAANGGWGAGQHSRQDIRDPRAVKTDPATTAFSAMALARLGNTIESGTYRENVKKALDYLLKAVWSTAENAGNITTVTGTQPQNKLGNNIDVSMTIQFFGKVINDGISNEDLEKKVNKAMDKCIAILGNTQQSDGSWNTAGWAPVLNSAMANNALEMSQTMGKEVDEVLIKSQNYQKLNIDANSGRAKTDKAAGIDLYAYTSSQRATAKDAQEAAEVFKAEKYKNADFKIPESEEEAFEVLSESVSEDKARKLASSYNVNTKAKQRISSDAVLSGFGNKGGEEYLSYMMTSESFVAESDEKSWEDWHKKMSKLFKKVQNGNGSWTGQHCITSPVFCTAAVILTLTADRDAEILLAKK